MFEIMAYVALGIIVFIVLWLLIGLITCKVKSRNQKHPLTFAECLFFISVGPLTMVYVLILKTFNWVNNSHKRKNKTQTKPE